MDNLTKNSENFKSDVFCNIIELNYQQTDKILNEALSQRSQVEFVYFGDNENYDMKNLNKFFYKASFFSFYYEKRPKIRSNSSTTHCRFSR